MMKILREIGVNWRDMRMITELYVNQEAVVRAVRGKSDPGVIGRRVRQGCPLSPSAVFNICRNDDEGSPGRSGRGNQCRWRVDEVREAC